MSLLIKSVMIAFLVSPFLLGILRKHGVVTDKQIAITIASILSLICGSYYLYLRKPVTLYSLKLEDWLVAVTISLFCWAYVYLLNLWIFKQWSQK